MSDLNCMDGLNGMSFENDFMVRRNCVLCFKRKLIVSVLHEMIPLGPAHFMTQGSNEGNNYSQRQRILNKGRY